MIQIYHTTHELLSRNQEKPTFLCKITNLESTESTAPTSNRSFQNLVHCKLSYFTSFELTISELDLINPFNSLQRVCETEKAV